MLTTNVRSKKESSCHDARNSAAPDVRSCSSATRRILAVVGSARGRHVSGRTHAERRIHHPARSACSARMASSWREVGGGGALPADDGGRRTTRDYRSRRPLLPPFPLPPGCAGGQPHRRLRERTAAASRCAHAPWPSVPPCARLPSQPPHRRRSLPSPSPAATARHRPLARRPPQQMPK